MTDDNILSDDRQAFAFCEEAEAENRADALGYYHEKRDEARSVGLGPEHDWWSHAADAFGMMCIAYEEPERAREAERTEHGEGGWMG